MTLLHRWVGRLVGMVALGAVAGCQPVVAPAPGPEVAVQGRLALDGYRLQTVLTAYTSASIDHVRLTLLANAGAGYVATGASVSVPRAGLAAAQTLSNLRAGTPYRVRADAYSAATESSATLISDATNSLTDFTTPAVAATGGVLAIDDTPVALVALKLRLLDQAFAGQANVTVALRTGLKAKVTTVTLTLFAGTAQLSQKSYAVAQVDAGATVPLADLHLNTTYKLQADGYNSTGKLESTASTSTTTFSTPAVTNGQVDDAIGTISVPCN